MRCLFVLLLILPACTPSEHSDDVLPVESATLTPAGLPARLCIVFDATGKLPDDALTPAQLARFADVVQDTGGELALTRVSAQTDQPLVRLHVPEPSVAPSQEHPLPNDPYARRQLERLHADQVQAYQADEAVRTRFVAEERAGFERRAELLLTQPEQASHSDVLGAVRRCELFFSEAPSANNYLLAITDGGHNAERPSPLQGTAPCFETWSVGLLVPDHALRPYEVRPFESVPAAARHFASSVRTPRTACSGS